MREPFASVGDAHAYFTAPWWKVATDRLLGVPSPGFDSLGLGPHWTHVRNGVLVGRLPEGQLLRMVRMARLFGASSVVAALELERRRALGA